MPVGLLGKSSRRSSFFYAQNQTPHIQVTDIFVSIQMDVLSLNQRFIRELLELYKDLPAVWKIKCPEYKNKMEKTKAYDFLTRKCREYVPDADREFVKNKINSLRSSFRKELRKVQASRARATNASEVYVPNLWYYHLLTFTADQEDIPQDDTSAAVETNRALFLHGQESSSSYEDSGDLFICTGADSNVIKQEPSRLHTQVVLLEEDPLSTSRDSPPPRKKPRQSDVVTQPVRSSSAVVEDVFDAIGKNVAHKLRGMSQQQQIIAEKIISDAMYHGQMETLTVDSRLINYQS